MYFLHVYVFYIFDFFFFLLCLLCLLDFCSVLACNDGYQFKLLFTAGECLSLIIQVHGCLKNQFIYSTNFFLTFFPEIVVTVQSFIIQCNSPYMNSVALFTTF